MYLFVPLFSLYLQRSIQICDIPLGFGATHMAQKKLQVFVSSTYLDLKEERQAAVEAILSAGHIPAGMELFTAGDQSQWEVIKEWIRESDVYMLILGGRYGSIEPESGKSYTHLEYEYAVEIGKPLFAVVLTEKALDLKAQKDGLSVIERNNSELYNRFKSQVMGKLIKQLDDLKDVKLAVHETLNKFARKEELIGWVRGDQVIDNRVVEEMARLSQENTLLKANLDSLEKSNNQDFKNIFEDLKNKKHSDSVEGKAKIINNLLSLSENSMIGYYYEIFPLLNGINPRGTNSTIEYFSSLGLVTITHGPKSITFNSFYIKSTENGIKFFFHIKSVIENSIYEK